AAACFFAASIAASSFDLHPASKATASAIAPENFKSFPENIIVWALILHVRLMVHRRAVFGPGRYRTILRCASAPSYCLDAKGLRLSMSDKTPRPQLAHLTAQLEDLRQRGTYFKLRVLDDEQASVCTYDGK